MTSTPYGGYLDAINRKLEKEQAVFDQQQSDLELYRQEQELEQQEQQADTSAPDAQNQQEPTADTSAQPQGVPEGTPLNPKDEITNEEGEIAEGGLADPLMSPDPVMAMLGKNLVDKGAGLYNFIFNRDNPQRFTPKYEKDGFNALSSLLGTVYTGVATGPMLRAAGAGLAATKFMPGPVANFLNRTFVQRTGQVFAGAGIETAATIGEPSTREDQNLLGTVKQAFPSWTGWISDDLATTTYDTPDSKFRKNILENLLLYTVSDVAPYVIDTLGLGRQTRGYLTDVIPENELAATALAKRQVKEPPIESLDDAIRQGYIKQQDAIDEVGTNNVRRAVEEGTTDQPIKGYHDVFDEKELATRSLDTDGIMGASIDAARIATNTGTINGRLASIIRQGGIKWATENAENMTGTLKKFADELRASGEYSYKAGTDSLSSAEIMEVGEELAGKMMDLTLPEIRAFVESMQRISMDLGIPELNEIGYSTVMSSIKKFTEQYANMDALKAQAYVATSVAGQASDIATASRIGKDTLIEPNAQEQVAEILKYLMVQRGMNSLVKGRGLRMLNLWSTFNKVADVGIIKRIEEESKSSSLLKAINKSILEADDVIASLTAIRQKNPELLRPFMLAIEYLDGDVTSISELARYWRHSTDTFGKFMVNTDPSIPSVIVEGFWANFYAKVLAGVGTPVQAAVEGQLMAYLKPVTQALGSAMGGDKETLESSVFLLTKLNSMTSASRQYAKKFWKMSDDPNMRSVLGREETSIMKNQRQWEILDALAEAAESKGNLGPRLLLDRAREQWEIANDSINRFGQRGLLTADAHSSMFAAQYEAYATAFADLKAGNITEDLLDSVQQQYLAKMFDNDGFLKDEFVIKQAKEIALNTDSKITDILGTVISYVPAIQPLMLFRRMPFAYLKLVVSSNPLGALPIIRKYAAFEKSNMSVDDMRRVLNTYGIEDDGDVFRRFNQVKAEMLGRKGLASGFVTSSVGIYMAGNLTGDQTSDAAQRRFRDTTARVPRRSIRGLDGRWYSYEWLPLGIPNWIATVANIGDEVAYGNLSSEDGGAFLKAMMYIFANSLGNSKDVLKVLEPVNDALDAKPDGAKRWAGAFLGSATPTGSNMFQQFAALLDQNVKAINQDLDARLLNRSVIRGAGIENVNEFTGKPIPITDNPFAHFINTVSPFDSNKGPDPRHQYLIEVDYYPNFAETAGGIELTREQQVEVKKIMAERGVWRDAVESSMEYYNSQEFRRATKETKAQVEAQGGKYDHKKSMLVINLHEVFEAEKQVAIDQLSAGSYLNQREIDKKDAETLQPNPRDYFNNLNISY